MKKKRRYSNTILEKSLIKLEKIICSQDRISMSARDHNSKTIDNTRRKTETMVVERSSTPMKDNSTSSHIHEDSSTTRNSKSQKSLQDAMRIASEFSVIDETADPQLHSLVLQISQGFRNCLEERSGSDLSLSLRCATSEHDQPLNLPMRQLSKNFSNKLLECSSSSDLSLSLRCATAEQDQPLPLPMRQLSRRLLDCKSSSNRSLRSTKWSKSSRRSGCAPQDLALF